MQGAAGPAAGEDGAAEERGGGRWQGLRRARKRVGETAAATTNHLPHVMVPV